MTGEISESLTRLLATLPVILLDGITARRVETERAGLEVSGHAGILDGAEGATGLQAAQKAFRRLRPGGTAEVSQGL